MIEMWRLNAACRGLDPAMFELQRGGDQSESIPARRVCAKCPVKCQCLEWSIRHERDSPMIWAGIGKRERYRLWQDRRRRGLL